MDHQKLSAGRDLVASGQARIDAGQDKVLVGQDFVDEGLTLIAEGRGRVAEGLALIDEGMVVDPPVDPDPDPEPDPDPDPQPDPDAPAFVLPTYLASALAKGAANTPQFQAYRTRFDGLLGRPLTSDYLYNGLLYSSAYAALHRATLRSNPTLAADYAGKAFGQMMAAVRDSQRGTYGGRMLVGRGDGSQTTFTLPHTPIAGTVSVWLYDVTTKALVRGAGAVDHAGIFTGQDGGGSATAYVLKVSNTPDGPQDYARGADWHQGAIAAGLLESSLTWLDGGSAPATSSTYHVTHTTAATLQGTGWSVAGNVLTLSVAPGPNKAVVVQYSYHAGSLRYQQTGNGLGGVGLAGLDNAYSGRYNWNVACAFDWLQGWEHFGAAEKAEVANYLVGASDLCRDNQYRDVKTSPESNYGAGWWVARVASMAALQGGRHAAGDRLKAEVKALWISDVRPRMVPRASDSVTSCHGGFTSEGLYSYGKETTVHDLVGVATLADAGIYEDPADSAAVLGVGRQLAADVLMCWLHGRYSTAATASGRPGLVFEAGDNSIYPVPAPNKEDWAPAIGLSGSEDLASYGRHLVANEPGTLVPTLEDLLFRDPAGPTVDYTATASGGTLGYSHHAPGQGLVIGRDAWNIPDFMWVLFHGSNRAKADHDQTFAGYLQVYRGPDRLLVSGSAIASRSAYNPLPAAAWNNLVLIDDGLAGRQTFPWNNSYVYGGRFPGYGSIPDPTVERTAEHDFVSCDYRAIYGKANGVNPCTELTRDFFFIRSSKTLVVYDRVTKASEDYASHLRWHVESTVHPVGSGTFTLTVNGQTTDPLAWDAPVAGTGQSPQSGQPPEPLGVRNALGALTSAGTVTSCVKYCNGHYRVTFDRDPGEITGTYSGGAVEVFRYSPTVLEIVLAGNLSGSTPYQTDVGNSRLFLKVDSTEPLARTAALAGIAQSTTARCGRLAFRNANPVASVRFVSSIQAVANGVPAMASQEHVLSTGLQLEGSRVGADVCLFPRGSTVTIPDGYAVTHGGAVTHRIAGLVANQTYDLTGADVPSATASPHGILVFTSTSAALHAIRVGETAPPDEPDEPEDPGDPPVFGMELIGDLEVGIGPDLAAIQAEESKTQGPTTWWPWVLNAHGMFDKRYPGLVLGNHHHPVGVTAFYSNNCNSPGGPISFTRQNPSGSLGAAAKVSAFNAAAAALNIWDYNGDGLLDVEVSYATQNTYPWRRKPDGTLERDDAARFVLGNNGHKGSNYYRHEDLNGDGYVDFEGGGNFPRGSTKTTADITYSRWTWDPARGKFVYSAIPFRWPAGVPQAVRDQVDAWIKANSPSVEYGIHQFRIDLDDDGTDDLVIVASAAYDPNRSRSWYLKDDGQGNLSDNTSAWGLPPSGTFLTLNQFGVNQGPRFLGYEVENFWHRSITGAAGAGVPVIFIQRGSVASAGMYRWDPGSGKYVRVPGDLTTKLSIAENYPMQVVPVSLQGRSYYDLFLRVPRLSLAFIFTNDGQGNFTMHTAGSHGTGTFSGHYVAWDAWGAAIADFDGNGKLDFAFGGENGPTGGDATANRLANKCSVYRNITTNHGNYLLVDVERTTGPNRRAIGGKVEVFAAGQNFAPSAKIGLMHPWGCGLPMHFGVDRRAKVDVRFTPPGAEPPIDLTGVATNQLITITD